jgi:putative tryptophan/tyrosine transport system substrate-binding protein
VNVRAVIFRLAVALGCLAVLPAAAQRVYRVGYLAAGLEEPSTAMLASFREGMRELGYSEGRHFRLESRYAQGKFETLPGLARDLVGTRPDAIVVSSSVASVVLKAATATVPIVFVGVADPVGVKLVSNLARPGENVTGITNLSAELTIKRLEIAKQLVPAAARIAVLYNPDDPNAQLQMRQAEAGAKALKVGLVPITLRQASDLEPGFAAAGRAGIGAAVRFIDPTVVMYRERSAQLVLQYRVPAVFAFPEDAEAGALASYGPSLNAQYRQAAAFIDKILRGARAGDLPVEQPTKFELVVNQKTAKALGLTVPRELLLRADRVIE